MNLVLQLIKGFQIGMWRSAHVVVDRGVFHRDSKSVPRILTEQKTLSRRQNQREGLKVPVHFRVRGMISQKVFKAKSMDFSQGGVRLIMTEAVPIGAHVEIRMRFPGMKKPTTKRGVVTWVKYFPPEERTVHCGIHFLFS